MTEANDVIDVWVPETEFEGEPEEPDEPPPGHPLLLAALTLVAAGITAALLLTAPRPAVGFDIGAALASVERTTTAALHAVEEATTVAELAGAADEVQLALDQVEDTIGHTDEIGDRDERRIVRDYLDHDKVLLTRLALLTSLPDSELHRWEALAADLTHAITVLDGLAPGAAAEDLAIAPAVLAASAQDAVAGAGALITDTRSRLVDWTAEVTRIELDKQAQLATLDSYHDAARTVLDRYAAVRAGADEFVGRVDTDGSNFEEVYGFLDSARTSHEDLRNTLAGIPPPPAVAGAHAGVLRAMDVAILELAAAAAGTAEFVWTNGMERYREAPAWQGFVPRSAARSTDFAKAVSAWEAQITAELLRLTAITPPLKPAT
jgi:hypothetical protein